MFVQSIQPSRVQAQGCKKNLNNTNSCTNFQKKQIKEKEKKRNVGLTLRLKRRKNLRVYETLLAELRLEDEYNYKNYLRMSFENFEEIIQLIKDDIIKKKTKMKDSILLRLYLAATTGFLSTGVSYKSYV